MRRRELPRSREAGGCPQETSSAAGRTQETVGGSGANEVSAALRTSLLNRFRNDNVNIYEKRPARWSVSLKYALFAVFQKIRVAFTG